VICDPSLLAAARTMHSITAHGRHSLLIGPLSHSALSIPLSPKHTPKRNAAACNPHIWASQSARLRLRTHAIMFHTVFLQYLASSSAPSTTTTTKSLNKTRTRYLVGFSLRSSVGVDRERLRGVLVEDVAPPRFSAPAYFRLRRGSQEERVDGVSKGSRQYRSPMLSHFITTAAAAFSLF